MHYGDDGIARWRRVADAIRAMAGERPDGRLPSEADLAERFGVNRHTVRRAIGALAADGLVRSERGRGTFFRTMPDRLHYPIGPRTRFSENISSQAREPAGRLIRAGIEPAGSKVAAMLGLQAGAAVHRMETLHVADSLPLSVSTSWFSADRFPRIVPAYAETGSITKALAAHGLTDYRRRETNVTAERISPDDADHLGCGADAVVIVAEAVNVDAEDRPVQFSRARFAADRIELVFRS